MLSSHRSAVAIDHAFSAETLKFTEEIGTGQYGTLGNLNKSCQISCGFKANRLAQWDKLSLSKLEDF